MSTVALTDPVIDELRGILGPENVLIGKAARYNRTRVPAPFPVHRWSEYVPEVVVLPENAQHVSEIVKLANTYRIPVVPRGGGTGLSDGAVPLRKGILLDIKRMNKIIEIDLENRTVTVQPGINMLKLNQDLRKYNVFFPDDPASYPCSIIGGRIGTSGFSLIAGRYGHTRDLVVSMQVVLPTGEIIEVGDGGGRKIRKSSTGFNLKNLFIGHQGSLGICTEATLELVPRPEVEMAAFFGYPDFETAYKSTGALAKSGLASLASVVLFDEKKVEYLRRDDEAYIPQPPEIRSVIATAMYGTVDEVRPAAKRFLKIARDTGGKYLGDEVSQGDWASRHDRYATPLHGRLLNKQVVPMSWHCEDASINYTFIPQVMKEWHEIARKYIEKFGIFDDWGCFFYSNSAYKPWGDYLAEIDIGIWEQKMDEENWAAWVECKREITRVSLKYQGSITSCHGSSREGDAEFVPVEMGGGFEVMKRIKKALDPNNIMNPGKNMLDQAYEEE